MRSSSAGRRLDIIARLTSSLLVHCARRVPRSLAFRFQNHAQSLLRDTETFVSSLAPVETSACLCTPGEGRHQHSDEGTERDGVARRSGREHGGCCCSPRSLPGGVRSPAVAVSIGAGPLGPLGIFGAGYSPS